MDGQYSKTLVIPKGLLKSVPTMDGKYFFTKPSNPADDHITNNNTLFPMNPNQQYQAPPLEQHHWPRGKEAYEVFDRILASIQEREAYITRPLDEFATKIFASDLDPALRRSITDFLNVVRSELSITARQIQQTRQYNYSSVAKPKPAPGSEKRTKAAATSSSKAHKQVGNTIFPSLISTLNPRNPLHTPEIRKEIAHYLSRGNWATCALICKDWNRTFSPLLYAAVNISGKGRTVPSIQALERNKDFITSFRATYLGFTRQHALLVLPNLKELKLHLNESSVPAGAVDIIKNKSIVSLELSRIVNYENSFFWKAVSELPNLESLSIMIQMVFERRSRPNPLLQVEEIQAFWDACSRVKKLSLSTVRFQHDDKLIPLSERRIPASTIAKTLAKRTFPNLQDLTISQVSIHVSCQVMIIMLCSKLERLEWRVSPGQQNDSDLKQSLQNLRKHFASGKSPNLKSLNLGLPAEDKDFEEIFESLKNKVSLEAVSVRDTQFGEHGFNALKYHFPTLQRLNLNECVNMTNVNVLEVLVSCPRLEVLTLGRVYAQDMDPQQVWPCHRTLHHLQINFELDRKPYSGGPSTIAAAAPKGLNETVFTCLGQLHQLRYLQVGSNRTSNQASIPLEIQLSKGFGKLAGLKGLQHFSMGILSPSLGPKEVDWMLANWPSLNTLEGTSDSKIPKQIVLKRRGVNVITVPSYN